MIGRLLNWLRGPQAEDLTNLSRRRFLRMALAAAPAIAISGELAELLAPRKTIILPPLASGVIGRYCGINLIQNFPIEEIIKKALAADMVKSIDRLSWSAFNENLVQLKPGAGLLHAYGEMTTEERHLVLPPNTARYALEHLNGLVEDWSG